MEAHSEGPACLMWYPPARKLIPVKSLIIYKSNAKFLECKFYKPDVLDSEIKTNFDAN